MATECCIRDYAYLEFFLITDSGLKFPDGCAEWISVHLLTYNPGQWCLIHNIFQMFILDKDDGTCASGNQDIW